MRRSQPGVLYLVAWIGSGRLHRNVEEPHNLAEGRSSINGHDVDVTLR